MTHSFSPNTSDHFRHIANAYSHFLIDMWGVVHNGVESLPGALDCLENLKAHDKTILFITNSSRPAADLAHLVSGMGIHPGRHYDYIHSSGDAVIEGLQTLHPDLKGKPYYYLGDTVHGHPLLPFVSGDSTPNLDQAAYILFTALTPFTDMVLEEALKLNLPLICANPDVVAIHGKNLSYCPGLAAQKYEKQGGNVIYYGKPYPPIYESALKKMGSPSLKNVVAVGDGLHTDIQGAQTMKIDSVLIHGGIHQGDSLEILQKKFQTENIYPHYILPRFCW
ncbi:MAG: TIGR01459 family HAD-type hydrolase [Alphaproteobacteria bacterium]